MTLLTIDSISKSYGNNHVLDQCSFTVNHGHVTGLIGPNGAGKTTLLDIISGIQIPDKGNIIFKDETITTAAPRRRKELGIARTFQITRPFSRMTVRDNILLPMATPHEEQPWHALRKDIPRERRQTAINMLHRFGLGDHADAYAGSLSGGQKRLLELARAFLTEPDLVIMDEPFAGISPDHIPVLMNHIRDLQDNGTTFLIVEHDLQSLQRVTDDFIVLLNGSSVSRGTLDQIRTDQTVIDGYLGADNA